MNDLETSRSQRSELQGCGKVAGIPHFGPRVDPGPRSKLKRQLLGQFIPLGLLRILVGAAGFEPTTCSTQNCRATRLRYTPNTREHDSTELNRALALSVCLGTIFSENRFSLFRIMPWETTSIHACAATSKPPAAVSSAAKERMPHAVSGRDPVLLCRASNHLEHPFRRAPRWDDPGR